MCISPNRENRDLATPVSGHPGVPAAFQAARARSRVCRARPDIEITRDIVRTTSPTTCRTQISARIAKNSTSRPLRATSLAARAPTTRPALALRCVGHGPTSRRPNPERTRRARPSVSKGFQGVELGGVGGVEKSKSMGMAGIARDCRCGVRGVRYELTASKKSPGLMRNDHWQLPAACVKGR